VHRLLLLQHNPEHNRIPAVLMLLSRRLPKRAARLVGAHYVRWNDLLCPAEKCFAVHGGHLLYRDRVHFSLAGAEFFGARMKSDPTFREMLLGSPASASSDSREARSDP